MAIAVRHHDSCHAARFAALVETLFPSPIRQILTDNGASFRALLLTNPGAGMVPLPACPRSPKIKAFNARFNRTVQEGFVDYEEEALVEGYCGC